MKLIFEKSKPGRRAGTLPAYDLPKAEVPEELARRTPPRLPEISEPELVRSPQIAARSLDVVLHPVRDVHRLEPVVVDQVEAGIGCRGQPLGQIVAVAGAVTAANEARFAVDDQLAAVAE